MKSLGHFLHGKWFCSPACSEKDPEAQKIKEMLEKKASGIVEKPIDEEDDDEDEGAESGDIDL